MFSLKWLDSTLPTWVHGRVGVRALGVENLIGFQFRALITVSVNSALKTYPPSKQPEP